VDDVLVLRVFPEAQFCPHHPPTLGTNTTVRG
jgi:hypothetical protein